MIPAYLWGRSFKIGRGERGSHMVLSDMKKLGHQCCLFIVINTATCFASAEVNSSLLFPSSTFMERGLTGRCHHAGTPVFTLKLAWKAETTANSCSFSIMMVMSACRVLTLSGRPHQSLRRMMSHFNKGPNHLFTYCNRRNVMNSKSNYCIVLPLRLWNRIE